MRYPRHGVHLDQTSQFAQRPQPEPWMWFDHQSLTEHRIERPGGYRDRRPIVELDDELFPAPTSGAPQDAAGTVVEGMISVIDRHRR